MSALIWERLDMATGIDGVQHTLPQNMTPWHTEHLKPKEFEKTAEAGRARPPVPPPPSFPKKVMKVPCERDHPCTRRREHILIPRDRELRAEKSASINLVGLTRIFLITSSPFRPLHPNPFGQSIRHKFLVSSCSGHFFGSLFSCENSSVHVKIH